MKENKRGLMNHKDFFDSFSDYIYVIDKNNYILYANDAFAGLINKRAEEVIGKFLGDFFPPHTADYLYDCFDRVFEENISFKYEKKYSFLGDIWFETNFFPVKGENGIYGAAAVSRDITERKAKEEEYRNYSENIALLLNTTMEFVDFSPEDDIYSFIAGGLKSFTKDCSIIVNSCEDDEKTFVIRTFLGKDGELEFINKLLGREICGIRFEINEEAYSILSRGRLVSVPQGFYGLTLKAVPEKICLRIEDELNFGNIYAMGFFRKEKLLGDIVIICPKGKELKNPEVIESFINHISLVLNRKHIEDQLRIKDEAIESSFCPVVMTGLDGKVIYVNKAFLRVWGYDTKSEVMGRPGRDFWQDKSEVLGIARKLFEKERWSGELTAKRKDGTSFDAQVSANMVKDKNGTPVCLKGSFVDITKKKKLVEELREARNYLDKIINSVVEPIFVKNREHAWILVNDAYCKLTGFSREELLGKSDYDFYKKEEADVFWEKDELVFETGKENINEEDFTDAGGNFHVIYTKKSLYVDNFNNKYIVGIITDITPLRRAYEKLSKSEARYRELADLLPQPVFETDGSSRFTFANKIAFKTFGYCEEDIYTKDIHLFDFIVPEDRDRAKKNLLNRLYGENVGFAEYTGVRKDGTILPILVNIIPKLHNSEPAGLRGVVIDITDRKKIEEELRKARDNAEMASRAKSLFLANMSHEIRTPLNGITGMIELLLETEVLTEEQKRYLNIAQTSADTLLSIINSILDFSAIETGRLKLTVKSFDLKKLIDKVFAKMAPGANKKGLHFDCNIKDNVPVFLTGDPERLLQIVTNIISNAIKFTEKGEVLVNISLIEEKEDKVRLSFEVSDSGIGISEEKIGFLFKAFYQVDDSITRKYGGTGLGLSISKELVEMMGGKIYVVSKEGEGSTFKFTCILEKSSEEIKEKIYTGEAWEKSCRILVVDDDEANRLLTCEQLHTLNFLTDEASSGEECLLKLRNSKKEKTPFSLAIVDLNMPYMDGKTLGRIIKDDPELSDIPLILLTALNSHDCFIDIKDTGFFDCLIKPVKIEVLQTALLKAMEVTSEEIQSVILPVTRKRKDDLRVLLAEDNITNQYVALNILKKIGCSVEAVNNGKEVIKALEKKTYDLIFMDLNMPEMDGLEATAAIRKMEKGDYSIPIIAMTAFATEDLRAKCFEAGMDDYLTKPLEPSLLMRAIDRFFGYSCETDETSFEDIETDEIFGYKAFLKRLDGDLELFKKTIELCVEDINDEFENLKEAFYKHKYDLVRFHLHSIKGAAANVSAYRIKKTAGHMSSILKDKELDKIPSFIRNLEKEFEQFKRILDKIDYSMEDLNIRESE